MKLYQQETVEQISMRSKLHMYRKRPQLSFGRKLVSKLEMAMRVRSKTSQLVMVLVVLLHFLVLKENND